MDGRTTGRQNFTLSAHARAGPGKRVQCSPVQEISETLTLTLLGFLVEVVKSSMLRSACAENFNSVNLFSF